MQTAALPVISNNASGMQQTSNAEVDAYVQGMIKSAQIPGVSLAVMENGKLIYAKAYGYANLETASQAKPEQRFEIGSISKSFASIAVLMLVDEGKMSLDAKISTYLGPVSPAWEAITIRQIMNHTSGIARDADEALLARLTANPSITEPQLLEAAMAMPLQGVPGASYSYSNVGYDVLGFIVSKVSGKKYGDFLQERIFGPFNMRDTRVMGADDSLAQSATGYVMSGTTVRPFASSPNQRKFSAMAAGAIESTALDMAKYDAALANAYLPSRAAQAAMWGISSHVQTAAIPGDSDVNYGLGWFLSTVDGHRKVYHSGQTGGFAADFIRYPDDGISVIVLTNQTYATDEPQLISRKVAQLFRPGLPFRAPK